MPNNIVDAIDDGLAAQAISPRSKESEALNAVTLLGAADEPNAQLLSSVVVHGRPSVARKALGVITRAFGEQHERLENIIAELKRVITSDHQNFELVKHL